MATDKDRQEEEVPTGSPSGADAPGGQSDASVEGGMTEPQALEGAVVPSVPAPLVPQGGYPMGPQPVGMMGPVPMGMVPPGWSPQAWYAAQQQAAFQWQQAGQVPQAWQPGMPPQVWPQGMPPQGWAQPGPPQGWQGMPPGMMPPPGYGPLPEGQGMPGPQPGWPQAGAQPYPGQAPQGMPYGWPMPPINVVVQNSQQNPQVVHQPQSSTVVQSAPGGASAGMGQAPPVAQSVPVVQAVVAPVFMAEPGQEVLVRTHARTRLKAVLLSFLFGWVGAQRFYLGQQWKGLLLLMFIVTPIPIFVGLWDGLRFLFMSDDDFDRLHNYSKIRDNRLLPPEGTGG